MRLKNRAGDGFTLIELSIVLVIIGLIVGGVLVGRELINAAAVRSQIAQIEKYHQATNTFRIKYGYLPGDIRANEASLFGLAARGPYEGQGDGNGLIEGNSDNIPAGNYGYLQSRGETLLFWVDLSTARLIDHSFSAANATTTPSVAVGATALSLYMPQGKIGAGNYIYAYSRDPSPSNVGVNYLGISAATGITMTGCHMCLTSNAGLTVQQASAIDKKTDDGLPQFGRVMAFHLSYTGGVQTPVWTGVNAGGYPSTAATPASSTTCYDNNNVAGQNQAYSITTNNGSGMNCALSFRFQ